MKTIHPRQDEHGASHRIRVGALGLACVFLLVILATALLRATSDTELANQEANEQANAAAPAEPLAQLGVAPGNPATDEAAPPSITAARKAKP